MVERADEVLELPVRSNNEGVVTLRDVARVNRTFKDRTSYARYNGQETISIGVTKRSDANVIDAVEKVLEVVERPPPCFRAVSASSRHRIRRSLRRYRYENSRAIS
ncbi:MAG: hypothetical protein CM15mP74_32980 [Halieaceae bacterium]|nr:MAG: hypothetical protein CM15mP74_32980 [Halieaceae bacterium]